MMSRPKVTTTLAVLEHRRQQLEYEVDRWLRSRGWDSTCETPGSFWLWTKVIDGKTFIVNKSLAENMERQLQADELFAKCKCDSDRDEHEPNCPAREA